MRFRFARMVAWLVLVMPASGLAQTKITTTDRLLVGSTDITQVPASDVARILGTGTVSGGATTMRPLVLDADGDLLRDTNTTVSTAGAWTWGGAGSFTSTLGVTGATTLGSSLSVTGSTTITGNVIGGTGTLQIASPTQISGTSASLRLTESDVGTDLKNWELFSDATQVEVRALTDALGSPSRLWRGYRSAATATLFELGGAVNALGFTTNAFTDIGSYVKKAKAIYTSELVADVFTIIEKQVIGNGSFRVGRGTTLSRDLTSAATTIYVKRKMFRYLDFVLMQGLGASGQPQFEVLRITGIYSDCTGAVSPLPSACGGVDNDDYAITVERNKEAQPIGNAWVVGDGTSGTDIYLDIFAWSSGMIAYGSAVLGDRSLFHVDFDGSSPTPIRSQTSGSVTIASGASTGGGGGLGSTGASWWRSTAGSLFTVNVPAINSATNQGAVLRCSMSVELVYYVTSTTPGAGSVFPLVKGPSGLVSPLTFAVRHQGNGVSAIEMIGTREGDSAFASLSPLVPVTTGWHHVVFTYSSANGGRAYLNGVLTGTPTAPIGGTTGCTQANNDDVFSTVFDGGHLSEADVYAYELGPEQVAAHFEAAQTNRAGLSAGPTMIGYERTSDTDWWGVSERFGCGNIVGLYGFQQKTYGCAWGDEAATWVSATASDGFSIWNAGVRKFWADTSGNLSLTGDLTIGTSGIFRSAAATALATGTGLYMAGGTTPVFRAGNPTGNRVSWDGTDLTVVSGNVIVDASGIRINPGTAFTDQRAFVFTDAMSGGTTRPGLYYREPTGTSADLYLRNDGGATIGEIFQYVESSGGHRAYVLLNANSTSGLSRIQLAAGDRISFNRDNVGSSSATLFELDLTNSNIKYAGSTGLTSSFTCGAGEAVKGMNVSEGGVITAACGVP